MKKLIVIAAIILLVIVITGFALFRQPGDNSATNAEQQTNIGVEATGEVKEVEITAKQWEFDPALIEVNLGDKVELHIESSDVPHGIVLPAFGISERLDPGKDVHVNFIADKTGTFNFYCNVPCGRGHSGMIGMLVVK